MTNLKELKRVNEQENSKKYLEGVTYCKTRRMWRAVHITSGSFFEGYYHTQEGATEKYKEEVQQAKWWA